MCVSLCVPAGCVYLHSELPDVHLLGFTLLFTGCHAGQGLRSVCMRLRNTRGKTALQIIKVLSAFSLISLSFYILISI